MSSVLLPTSLQNKTLHDPVSPDNSYRLRPCHYPSKEIVMIKPPRVSSPFQVVTVEMTDERPWRGEGLMDTNQKDRNGVTGTPD